MANVNRLIQSPRGLTSSARSSLSPSMIWPTGLRLSRVPRYASASSRRTVQNLRFKAEKGIYCNAQMNSRLLHQYAWPDEQGLAKLKDRMTKLNMSARAFDRILRVARTIADFEYAATMPAEEAVTAPVLSRHIAEAIGYRALDRASYGQIF